MSETSEYFKNHATNIRKSSAAAFEHQNIINWLNSVHNNTCKVDSPKAHAKEDEAEGLDRDDTRMRVKQRSSKIAKKPYDAQHRTKKISTPKLKSSRPPPPLFPKAKVFTPRVLVHNHDSGNASFISLSAYSQDIFEHDTTASSSSFTNYVGTRMAPAGDIYSCLKNINSYLDDLSSYCPSVAGIEKPCTTHQATQTEPQDYPSQVAQNMPRRAFNENSFDPMLAYTDVKKFIKCFYEEIVRHESESSIEDFINSQTIASQTDYSIKVVSTRGDNISMPNDQNLLKMALQTIYETEDFGSSKKFERPSIEMSNDEIISKIHKLVKQLQDDSQTKKKLQIKTPRIDWKNTIYKDGVLKLNKSEKGAKSTLQGRSSLVLYLLRKVYGLLMLGTQLTQRSLYYQLLALVPTGKLTQAQVTAGLQIIFAMLDAPQWRLNVLSTSKGLIYGDLTFTFGKEVIKCNAKNGTLVPMDINDIRKVKTSAHFIIIVEKDTVFQKLLVDNLPNNLAQNFILVTGKGYPDITTRRLLNALWKLLSIPMFILVDADAYGVDIFLTYKFGSLSSSYANEDLALPKLKWLGVLPSELKKNNAKLLPLQAKHCKKLMNMLSRPYFQNGNNAAIKREINHLIETQRTCEIEGLYASNKYFALNYLPSKLYRRAYV